MFLGGAYQEALGGLHNLFGGPSVVRVSQSDGPHCERGFVVWSREDKSISCRQTCEM
uniref:Arginine decarboxylase n=1 Tax=Aegilops tauschii subsp. strangulata TaxID=200361 RepID=A0A453KWX1_AEGTS